MAPSSRKSQASKFATATKNAPSIKTSSFGRVSKSSRLNSLHVKPTDAQKAALVKILGVKKENDDESIPELKLSEEKKLDVKVEACLEVRKSSKRKIDEVESEDEEEKDLVVIAEIRSPAARNVKARKIQLLSPPVSRCGTDSEASSPNKAAFDTVKTSRDSVDLSPTLRDLISLHAAFLKALSLHFAHNGPSSPAELSALTTSMTRIWKKFVVSKETIQRMLALYEIAGEPDVVESKTVEHRDGPFKLATSGLGMGVRTSVEFVGRGMNSKSFEESRLQIDYERTIRSIFNASRNTGHSNFVNGPISEFPMLAIPIGIQTQARQGKASATRAEILNLSNAAQSRLPNFARLSIDSDQPDSMSTSASTKSRTLSLFDRVKAKGLASSLNTAPSSEQILRRHAIGRIAEVVEFLRMKQQQKLGALFTSSIQDSSEQMKRAKVSFSLNSIVNEIRQSVPIPIGDEEVRCCLKVLSQEVPQWLSCLSMGTVQSVTLIGQCTSGLQVRRAIEEKDRRS